MAKHFASRPKPRPRSWSRYQSRPKPWSQASDLKHTYIHPFYGSLDFVQDYLGQPVPEPIWILLKQETVSGSSICWDICNAYSLRAPARSPSAGDTWVHLIPHSTHPQSSSLHGAVKAGSLSEIEKRPLPPPCFPSFNFQSTRSQGATLALLPPVLM